MSRVNMSVVVGSSEIRSDEHKQLRHAEIAKRRIYWHAQVHFAFNNSWKTCVTNSKCSSKWKPISQTIFEEFQIDKITEKALSVRLVRFNVNFTSWCHSNVQFHHSVALSVSSSVDSEMKTYRVSFEWARQCPGKINLKGNTHCMQHGEERRKKA